MDINNCEKCKRECEYIEVQKFIEYINQEFNYNYSLTDCPDQAKKGYTCDLLFSDSEKEEKMYVEVKRVELGFGKVGKSNKLLGCKNGQTKCFEIIVQLIEQVDNMELLTFLEDCVINIPFVQLRNAEEKKFEKQFAQFLSKLEVDEVGSQFCFVYEEENKKIEIFFQQKDEEMMEKFGDGILYSYATENGNSLYEIYEKIGDTKNLFNLICKNFNETSSKKFPQDSRVRVLLNILKIPTGYEVFFNSILNPIMTELNKLLKEHNFETYASEGYLLYYCDDFYTVNEKRSIDTWYENALLIMPVLGVQETMKQSFPIIFYDNIKESQ